MISNIRHVTTDIEFKKAINNNKIVILVYYDKTRKKDQYFYKVFEELSKNIKSFGTQAIFIAVEYSEADSKLKNTLKKPPYIAMYINGKSELEQYGVVMDIYKDLYILKDSIRDITRSLGLKPPI
jgi:uncharacterized protein YrrD